MSLSDADRARVVETIRTYMARERISREEFAERAKLGKSTVDKLATGMFSERTLLQIEARLNLKLREHGPTSATAPAEFGSYTREEGAYFLGTYAFVRPSFREPAVVNAFHMDIVWGDDHVLRLQEGERKDDISSQSGKVHIPRGSNHLFIASNENGWLQTVIVTQMDVLKRMRGIMVTVGPTIANLYLPVAVPVVLIKVPKIEPAMVGRIGPESPHYEGYHRELLTVETDNYVKWVRP